MKPKIENFLEQLLSLANEERSPIYVVGGTLRDRFLGKTNTDYDFASSQSPTMAKIFAKANKLPLVVLDDTPQRETYRVIVNQDVYFDFTRMQGQSIEEDLAQRDFTINAMAQPLEDFLIGKTNPLDPHGGKSDLHDRVLRVLPGPIFENDPLRLLRALRFAASLNFTLEENTFQKMIQLNQRIQSVAVERITQELLFLLNAPRSKMELMSQSGLLATLLPEVKSFNADEYSFLENVLIEPQTLFPKFEEQFTSFISSPMHRALIKMAFLLLSMEDKKEISEKYSKNRNNPSSPQQILKRLKWSNSHISFVDRTLWFHDFLLNQISYLESSPNPQPSIYRFVRDAGEEVIPAIFLTGVFLHHQHWKPDLIQELLNPILNFYFNIFLPKSKFPVLLDGNRLQTKFNLRPSPRMKIILAEIEEARVLGTINTPIEAEELARTLIQEMEHQANHGNEL